MLYFFFYKQKTACEVRSSDWSSDVCSSDLERHRRPIFWQRRKGCRRSGGYRTDKVELCTRHSHGGLHRSGAYQVDGMNEYNKQNEALNEAIAEASGPAQSEDSDPILAERDAAIADLTDRLLSHAAEPQNIHPRQAAETADP